LRFRVTYHRPGDLIRDHDEQFARGGVWLPLGEAPALELFTAVELELGLGAAVVVLDAQVIQQVAGAGVALGFTPSDDLARLVAAARRAGDLPGAPPSHAVVGDGAAGAAGEPAADDDHGPAVPSDVHGRVRAAAQHEKIQIALRGTRDERAAILRDPTARSVHPYVLRNPQLGIDEVAMIAGMRSIAPDVLKQIAERREWAQRAEVASALVRNPKTPVPLAIRMVAWVPLTELRQLAKASSLRGPILREIRKRVIG